MLQISARFLVDKLEIPSRNPKWSFAISFNYRLRIFTENISRQFAKAKHIPFFTPLIRPIIVMNENGHPPAASHSDAGIVSRRSFLGVPLGFGTVVMGAALSVPLIRFALHPLLTLKRIKMVATCKSRLRK